MSSSKNRCALPSRSSHPPALRNPPDPRPARSESAAGRPTSPRAGARTTMHILHFLRRALLPCALAPCCLLTLGSRTACADDKPVVFAAEVRFGGFYGTKSQLSAGGLTGGPHLGAMIWFTNSVGVQVMAGAELGVLLAAAAPANQTNFDGTAVISGEIGPTFNLSGDRYRGAILSFAWAPRAFFNFVSGQVASPVGGEVAIRFGGELNNLKIPLWYLSTADGTSFFGGALSIAF